MDEDMELDYPTEEDYNEVFGTEGSEQEEEGREEATEGAESAEETGGTPDTGEQAEAPTGETEGGEMPPEERHRQAAMRREREERARAEAAQEAMQASRDEVFREMFGSQINPFTGRPVQGEADYRDYQAKMRQREQEQQLQEAGLPPDLIRDAVAQELQPVREQLEQQRLQMIRERAAEANRRAEASLQQSIANIGREDPTVHSLEDIVAKPTGKAFGAYVEKGLSIEEAFFLANREELQRSSARAAHAAALNGAASRQHMAPGPAQGGGRLELTQEQIRNYRAFNEDASLEEIQKAYEAEMKE